MIRRLTLSLTASIKLAAASACHVGSRQELQDRIHAYLNDHITNLSR